MSAFILETEGLVREFSGFVAVDNVNLRIREGAICAIIGPNGAGKTTCFNLLTKFLQPTRGRIRYRGSDITDLEPADVARLGLGRSFQISAVFPGLTSLQNVRMALQRRRGESLDFWRAESALDVYDERAMQLLQDVGLASFAGTLAAALPYGRKRALEIATTLALDPQLLLLDEPTAGMTHKDVARTMFATLIFKAAYEATMWAAVLNARRGASRRMLLTRLGGGAFGNRDEWIDAALRRSLAMMRDTGLDVRMVSFAEPPQSMLDLVREFGTRQAR